MMPVPDLRVRQKQQELSGWKPDLKVCLGPGDEGDEESGCDDDDAGASLLLLLSILGDPLLSINLETENLEKSTS